jgi:transposase-like protein
LSWKWTSGNFQELISADLAVSLINSWKFQTAKKMSNNNKPVWGYSVRKLPWDNQECPNDLSGLTDSEKLISKTVHSWYDAKHSAVSREEVDLVNSIEVDHCPLCGSVLIHKNGHYKSGMQCYRCRDCGSKFSPLTGTIFDSHKIPISEWIEYLIHLFEFHSITTSARDNRNASSTGKYWLLKVFRVLQNIQDDVKLSGNVYFDEIFFSVVQRKIQRKEGIQLRGISRNKIAVAVGYDDKNHIVLSVENTSKPSMASTWKAMGTHIVPGSHLIHDGEHSHYFLINELNLTESVYPSKATKGLDDKDNPLDPINNLHALIRKYMNAHGGYNRDNLQDWMNLIWFVLSPPFNRYEKIKKFIEMAIISPERVKYRDVMSKKVHN